MLLKNVFRVKYSIHNEGQFHLHLFIPNLHNGGVAGPQVLIQIGQQIFDGISTGEFTVDTRQY